MISQAKYDQYIMSFLYGDQNAQPVFKPDPSEPLSEESVNLDFKELERFLPDTEKDSSRRGLSLRI